MRPLACSALVCLLSATACHRGEDVARAATAREAAAPVKVTTTTVVDKPMPELLTLTGSLKASSASEIAADVSGKVVATFVERGQAVKRGQIIARIDSRTTSLAALAAGAQAKLAQTQLDDAKRDCDRFKQLLQSGAISQAEYDRQTSTCLSRQWSAAAAEAQQQSAAQLAGDSSIRAPFDGLIGERYVSLGQYVQPSSRVASVYDADPLRLELTVAEANVAAVKVDTKVSFTVTAYGDQVFEGTVKYISPNVREMSRDMIVEALVPNADMKLKPGMFAVAKIDLGDVARAVVPKDAVVRQDTGTRVFVVEGALVQERLVQVGETVGDRVAILEGVKAGDAVVVTPGPGVRDGARVE